MYRKPMNGGRMPRALRRVVPVGTEYLGEDETYWYFQLPDSTNQLGGLFDNIGNMFSRMVKFTPKSFTPGNIYKGFVNTTLTVASGGLYQVLPKSLKKTVYEVGKVAIPVIAGGVLAVTAGPAIMGALMPKLAQAASLVGKAVSTVGGGLMNFLGKLSPGAQSKLVEAITPQQIAMMEQSQTVPPELVPMFREAERMSLPGASSGAASLYNPFPQPVAEAGMGLDMNMVLLIGVPAAFFVMTQMTGKRR
jgi:hypothetical protein